MYLSIAFNNSFNIVGETMLLSFGAKNFFCFKEWVEISLALNSKVPPEISQGMDATLTLCLKGGNASGKTNALKILSFLSFFCTNSFNLKPDEPIPYATFFDNELQSDFFVEFEADSIKYLYELTITKNIVISEKIYKKDKRSTLVFSRSKNMIKRNTLTKQKTNLLIRNNASVISTFKQLEIKEFDPFYNFFNNIKSNVTYFGLVDKNQEESSKLSEFYINNAEYLEFTTEILRKFDTGISDVKIETYKDSDNKLQYFPLFIHNLPDATRTLLFHSQSSGTKSLFNVLAIYYLTLKIGGILVLDEFDITLHPDILPHLVAMFESSETNPHNAQLLFSTHNNDIIDIMGKYKTYLFNKENGESFCYRLDELKDNIIRNDRPISPLYKSGKIGGIPRI